MASDFYDYRVRLNGEMYDVSVCDYVEPNDVACNLTITGENGEIIDREGTEEIYNQIGKMIVEKHSDVEYRGGWCPSGSTWGPDDVKYYVDWEHPMDSMDC